MFPLSQRASEKKAVSRQKNRSYIGCIGLRRFADAAGSRRSPRKAGFSGSMNAVQTRARGPDLSCDPLQNIVTARPWFVPRACLSETKQKITNGEGASMLLKKRRQAVFFFYWVSTSN